MTTDVEQKIEQCDAKLLQYQEEDSRLRLELKKLSKLISAEKGKKLILEGKSYYVYVVYVDAHPVYIGKGKGDRYKHAISGVSSCAELNRDYFANKYIEVRKVYTDLTEQQALRFEDEFIGYFSEYSIYTGVPIYNRTKSKTYSYMDIHPTYYYWAATHAIDNSEKKGVRVVQPDEYVHPKPEYEYA